MSRRPKSSQGFTLIESLAAILLLSLGMLALGSLLTRSSQQSIASSSAVQTTAAMTTEVGRLNVLPWDQLAAGNVCDTVTSGQMPRIRCTLIADVSSTTKEVRVIVTPTITGIRPDTVRFQRTKTDASGPLSL
jgi:prepilin-type N-terminal cleavage/methylation domain-containing protein